MKLCIMGINYKVERAWLKKLVSPYMTSRDVKESLQSYEILLKLLLREVL